MSRIAEYIHKFHTTPTKMFIRQMCYKLGGKVVYGAYHLHDGLFDTRRSYQESRAGCVPLEISAAALDVTNIETAKAEQLWQMYQAHRFDLLGSGWVRNGFMDNAPGLEGYRYESLQMESDSEGEFLRRILNRRNLKSSQRIWKLISLPYEPIDWQKDYKSGYRWGADQWYRPQGNAKKPGGDIKVPWELARLQHFPRMAVLALKFPAHKEEIFTEFCHQLLDFIAQNPPRMGVNYMCTMDVGIRTANVALAYSFFRTMGMSFSGQLDWIIADFMFQQCNHIRRNLEWSDILTSNHYFANIAGLLYGSAILPECRRKNAWLQFAVKQIEREIKKQFYAEGTNQEGSTGYHRLTGEMAAYSLALIHYLSKRGKCADAEKQLYDIIRRAGAFTESITRPDGAFTQIGDNDSGLFFRLSITGELLHVSEAKEKYHNLQNYAPESPGEIYLDECMNDARTFCSAVYGMCKEPRLRKARDIYPLECSLMVQLVGKDCGLSMAGHSVLAEDVTEFTSEIPSDMEYHSTQEFLASEGNLLDGLKRISYPSFGVYIYKSQTLYLCINASDNGQKGNAGHAHNDKLSFELFLNGNCIFQDSGVYVYTPLSQERNRFRSVRMHNTIDTGKEQNEFITLFSMKSDTKCRCLCWSDTETILEVRYGTVIHIRQFYISEDKITVTDYCNVPFQENWRQGEITCGYGKRRECESNRRVF